MLILKIVQTVTVIITQTNQITYLAKVGYFNLKQNPSVQVHYKKSSLLHSLLLLYRGNASKTTHDVSMLFTRQGEQPCCCSLAPLAFFLFFVCLFNFSCTEQPAVMLEQTSKNRSAVLRYIRCMRKQYKWRQLFALIANECPKTDF